VPGLFLIGAASGRDLIKLGMNQGWEVVEHLLGREVEPADEQILREAALPRTGRFRADPGPAGEDPPLRRRADEQLREMLLATEVRDYADGETIIRQNDYTNEFLVIESRPREISRPPEGGQERKVAS
jgi:hypothetical protein